MIFCLVFVMPLCAYVFFVPCVVDHLFTFVFLRKNFDAYLHIVGVYAVYPTPFCIVCPEKYFPFPFCYNLCLQ